MPEEEKRNQSNQGDSDKRNPQPGHMMTDEEKRKQKEQDDKKNKQTGAR